MQKTNQENKSNPKLFTLEEAAKYLNISRHSLYDYVADRKIAFLNFSKTRTRRYLFLEEDLNSFLLQNRTAALPDSLKKVRG
jgi:excisionase family DNA binding protein